MPLSLLRLSAECLKILLNFSSVIASHSFVEILRIPGKGVNSISFVGFENRFQGQTSWHISQPKAQFSNLPFISVGISCLLYTSDAADERSSVDLGGRRIIKK